MLLAEKLNGTTQQATSMNENLGEYLKGLAKWRENSLKLVEEQQVLTTNHAGEQTAILSLDSGIKLLMMQSQSLVESSKHSLATSDDVYKHSIKLMDKQKKFKTAERQLFQKVDLLLNDEENGDEIILQKLTKILANSRIGIVKMRCYMTFS